MRILIVIMMMWSAMSINAQEIWQLTPWPPDSNYVLGALPSGEPTWVHKDSTGISGGVTDVFIEGDSLYTVVGSDTTTVGYLYQGAVYFLGTPYDIKKGDFYKSTNLFNPTATKNQIWDGSAWIDFDKDIYLDNELTTYHTASIPILPKKGDLWYNPNLSPAQLQIHTGSGWVNVSYYDADLVPYIESSGTNKTEFTLAPTSGLNFEIRNETDGIIKLDYTDLGGGLINKQRWSIDTVNLNNLVTRDTALISQIVSDSLATYVFETDTSLINQLISDSLATIVFPNDSTIVTNGTGISVVESPANTFTVTNTAPDQVVTIAGASGTYPNFTVTNPPDSTIVQNSYGTIITESPSNTWNIKVDSTKFATPYDLTLIPNPPDSTVIVDGWGITSVESPTNTYNLMADSSQVFTQYDGTLKQDKLPSFTAGSVIFSNGTTLAQDNSNLFYDDSNNRLGIGTTAPSVPLDIYSSNSSDNGTYQKWAYSPAPTLYNLLLKQTVTSGNVRYNFTQTNAGTEYPNTLVLNRGSVLVNGTTDSDFKFSVQNADAEINGVRVGLGGGSESSNLAFGNVALNANTTGILNMAIGSNALSNANLNGNTAIGSYSQASRTSGGNNLSIGSQSMRYANVGGNNIALGSNAGIQLTGDDNIFIGGDVGFNMLSSSGNTIIGAYAAGLSASGANNNVYIGKYAGYYNTDKSGNIMIGYFSGYNSNASNRLAINNGFGDPLIGGQLDNGLVGIKVPLENIARTLDINGEVRIRDLVTDTPTRIVGADADGDLGEIVLGTGLSFTGNTLNATGGSGSTEYLDPYVISSDTVGFILKNVMDTVQFIGVAGVTGESTTVSDSPTINMTLTGTNITGEIVDGSVTPAKLSQAYLTSEVDGSTTNEIQTLSISGSDLTISGAGGNTVTLPNSGGSSEWASLHYGSLAANTQTLTSSVWNTINFTGSSESNASIIDANHTNDEIEFVVAGTYRVDYRVSFIANADALIYSGIYSSTSSSVDVNTQMESDTDSGYKHTIMQHSYIKTAVAGEKIKLQVQPLIAHTSVAIYSNFIVTKL